MASGYSYGINPNLIDKPDKTMVARHNLNFKDTCSDLDGLVANIKKGYAFTIATYEGRTRNKDNIESVQLLALDFDNKSGDHLTLPEALQTPEIVNKASLVYTSASHTQDNHRFRVVYLLERPITAAFAEYLIREKLLPAFPAADKACSSAQYFYFGNSKAEIPFFNYENKITNRELDKLEEEFEILEQERREALLEASKIEYPTDLERDQAMSELALEKIPPRQVGANTYERSFKVFAAIIHHFGKELGLALIRKWSPENNEKGSGWHDLDKKADGVLKDAERIRQRTNGTLGLGTVFKIATEFGFNPKQANKLLDSQYNPYHDYTLPEKLVEVPEFKLYQFINIAEQFGFNWKDSGIVSEVSKDGFVASDKFTQEYCWEWIRENKVKTKFVEDVAEAQALIDGKPGEAKLAIAIPSMRDWFPAKRLREAVPQLKSELTALLGETAEHSVILQLNSDNYSEQHLEVLTKKLCWGFPLNKWKVAVICAEEEINLNNLQKQESLAWTLAELKKRNKLTPTKTIHQQYLGDIKFKPDSKLIGLCSAKGTGKSTWYQALIQKLKREDRRILLIVHRRKLGLALSNQALIPYLKEVIEIGNSYGLCLCSDSLHTDSSVGRQVWELLQDPNLVVIVDELEQSLLHILFSSTAVAKKRPEVLSCLQKAFANALNPFGGGKVIVADADLTDVSINFIKQFAGHPEAKTEVLLNTWKKEGREAVVYTDKDSWLVDLEKALAQCVEDKKNGVVQRSIHLVLQARKEDSKLSSVVMEEFINEKYPSLTTLRSDAPSTADPTHPANLALSGDFNQVLEKGFRDFKLINKSNQRRIHDWTPEEQKRLQTEEMQQEVEARLKIIGEVHDIPVDQIDVLLSTQTLGTGISFDAPIFKEIFANFAGVGTVAEALQSIDRVRDNGAEGDYKVKRSLLISEEAYPFDKKITTTKPGVVLKQLREDTKSALTITRPGENLFDAELSNVVSMSDPLLLYCKLLAKFNLETHHYRDLIIYKLGEEGFDITFNEKESEAPSKKKLKEISTTLYNKKICNIANAEDITQERFETINAAQEKTREQVHQETKYLIKSKWGLTAPTQLQVQANDEGLYKKERMNFLVCENPETYLARDKNFLATQTKGDRVPFIPDLHRGLVANQVNLLQNPELGLVDFIQKANTQRNSTQELLQKRRDKANAKADKLKAKNDAAEYLNQLQADLEEVDDKDIRKKIRSNIKIARKNKKDAIAEHKKAVEEWQEARGNILQQTFSSASKAVQQISKGAIKLKDLFQRYFGVKLREPTKNNLVEIAGQVLRLVGIEWLQVQQSKDAEGEKTRYYLPVAQSSYAFDQGEIEGVYQYWRDRAKEPEDLLQQTSQELKSELCAA